MNVRPTQGFLDEYILFSGRDRDIALEPARVQKLRGLEIVDLGRYKPQEGNSPRSIRKEA